jgi:hypothetical protein
VGTAVDDRPDVGGSEIAAGDVVVRLEPASPGCRPRPGLVVDSFLTLVGSRLKTQGSRPVGLEALRQQALRHEPQALSQSP